MSTVEVFPGALGALPLQKAVQQWAQHGLLGWTTLSAVLAGTLLYGTLLAVYRRMAARFLHVSVFLGWPSDGPSSVTLSPLANIPGPRLAGMQKVIFRWTSKNLDG
jgi:hypothetical protein